MRIHQVTAADAIASLQSGVDGLSEAEASRRLTEYGPNAVERIRREPLLKTFANGFVHFFAMILWVAAALALVAEWREPGQGMVTLAAAIVLVILINGAFSFWQQYRAEPAVAGLQRLLPHRVRRVPRAPLLCAPRPDASSRWPSTLGRRGWLTRQ